jgi:ATP-dependent DNA helicase RecQ
MCDNCRNPKQMFDGKEDIATAIEAVLEVKERHKTKDVVNAMLGLLTATGKTYKHNELEIFGKGDEEGKDEKFWNAVIRQGLVNGLLVKDIENYGLLKATEKGKKFIDDPYTIMLTRDHDYHGTDKADDDDIALGGGKGSGAADQTLFALLKDEVKKIAKMKKLPPYVIFQETSLEEMSIQYPTTMDELTRITGVGSGKATKFGSSIIALIKKYVEENDIERPQDMVVKSVVNKSGLKVHIIQSVDRKVGLEAIAKGKQIGMNELLTEIETIVLSGTRMNINYYIDEMMDPEKQEEVYEYFKESETDSVQAALKELGEDDYSEEEVRLMRIKFLSEFGN